jgi:hypothetical protein
MWGKGGKCVMHRGAVRRYVWDSEDDLSLVTRDNEIGIIITASRF